MELSEEGSDKQKEHGYKLDWSREFTVNKLVNGVTSGL
jgi:hypothetical protein